jgi:hypothetical protein
VGLVLFSPPYINCDFGLALVCCSLFGCSTFTSCFDVNQCAVNVLKERDALNANGKGQAGAEKTPRYALVITHSLERGGHRFK